MKTINTISDKFEEALNDYAIAYYQMIDSLCVYFLEKYGKEINQSDIERDIESMPIIDSSEWDSLICAMGYHSFENASSSITAEVWDKLKNDHNVVIVEE
jgi:hypothetical protein